MLNSEEIQRYSRQLILDEVGPEGQLKLKTARVLVVGAGGLGCPLLQYLAGAGLGAIGIADFDTVALHNLHRQVLYTTADVGRSKALVAAERLQSLNPNGDYRAIDERITELNAEALIEGFDIVVDGSDNFRTRYTVNDACARKGKPLVYGSVLGFEAQLAVFHHRGGPSLRDLYPEPPDPGTVPDCSENGVLGVVPGIAGSMMAAMALQLLLDEQADTGHLLIADLRHFRFRRIRISSAVV